MYPARNHTHTGALTVQPSVYDEQRASRPQPSNVAFILMPGFAFTSFALTLEALFMATRP